MVPSEQHLYQILVLCVYLQNKSTLNWQKSKKYREVFQPLEPH